MNDHELLEQQLNEPHPTGAAASRRPPKVPLAPMKRLQPKFNPMADWANYVVVFLGGFIGTAFRFLLCPGVAGLPDTAGTWSAFHLDSLLVNVIASFVFSGVVTFCAQAIWIRKRVRQLASRGIGMGICGGMSTMTAVMLEDLLSWDRQNYGGLIVYTLVTLAVCLFVAWFGAWSVIKLTANRAARAMMEVTPDGRAKPAIGVRVPMPDDPKRHWWDGKPHVMASEPDPITDELPQVMRMEGRRTNFDVHYKPYYGLQKRTKPHDDGKKWWHRDAHDDAEDDES
ncbi:fluoride efflux transporter FluC [Bifidobacterium magnum]|uniref:Fluoride-specific ion channel n=1 Tax=Bifidobacterium magnum TaxID=1692 RepID=A0A087BAR2_9BIFI|nr:CrcB family protein [Bifidobacterium magnum]KFI68112.1 CrcB-like protein [Bifidobacterium magnum]